ncbi:MAG: translation initiation factor IF-2, partial [Xanthomonadales bacterium]|nr:translation initiation factor IF-2 [Xanthomonadales bacterium]
MSDVTVQQLAQVLGMTADKLLAQLSEAGMKFDAADQVVSSTEKVKLLGFLRRTHGKKEEAVETGAPKQITLKRKQVGELTVSSGAAKGKTVNVEVRQKRTYVKRSEVDDQQAAPEVDPERENALKLLAESKARNDAEQKRLSEMDAARRAEFDAQRRELEDRQRAEEAVVEAAKRAEVEAASLREEEEARAGKKHHHEAPKKIEDKAPAPVRKEAPKGSEPPHRHKGAKGSHRMVVTDVVEDDGAATRFAAGELHLPGDHARRPRKKPRPSKPDFRFGDRGNTNSGVSGGFSRPTAPMVREVAIGESIVVADLATKLASKGADVVKALFKMGVMATINQSIDHDTAVLVVEELGHKAMRATETDAESALAAQVDQQQGERTTRPPVVTIMGHVDHGKTSLLDYIRRTKVAAGEAGGITQHIGAYHVETDKGVVSFLDTPGHAAFTQMRARGAKLTDIVILVVAADDGVMPQTIEAVQHARAAKVPLIVAVNKMDKPDADPERVKQGLIQHEVVPEEWGGDTIFVPVSAKTGMGVDNLLDAVLVQAEMMELTAVADGRASGTVIESSLDKGRGPVATVLVQSGTLNRGDFLVCGIQYGRVRAMFDEAGRPVSDAGPSIPVVVLGLSGVPDAGDDFIAVEDERLAKDVAQQREQKRRETRLVKQQSAKMEDVWSSVTQGDLRT